MRRGVKRRRSAMCAIATRRSAGFTEDLLFFFHKRNRNDIFLGLHWCPPGLAVTRGTVASGKDPNEIKEIKRYTNATVLESLALTVVRVQLILLRTLRARSCRMFSQRTLGRSL